MNTPPSVTPADVGAALLTGLRALGVRGRIVIDLSAVQYVVVTLPLAALHLVAEHLRAAVVSDRSRTSWCSADLPIGLVRFVSYPRPVKA